MFQYYLKKGLANMNEWRHKIMNNAIKGGIKIWTSKILK